MGNPGSHQSFADHEQSGNQQHQGIAETSHCFGDAQRATQNQRQDDQ
jgi:hypothetical protein